MTAQRQDLTESCQFAPVFALVYRGISADADEPRIVELLSRLLRLSEDDTRRAINHPPLKLAEYADRERLRKHQMGLARLGCISSIEACWSYADWSVDDALKELYAVAHEDVEARVFGLIRVRPAPGHATLSLSAAALQHAQPHVLNHEDLLLETSPQQAASLREDIQRLSKTLSRPGAVIQTALGLYPQDAINLSEMLDTLQRRLDERAANTPSESPLQPLRRPFSGRQWPLMLHAGSQALADLATLPLAQRCDILNHWPVLCEAQTEPHTSDASSALRTWQRGSDARQRGLDQLRHHCEHLDRLPTLPAVALQVYRLTMDPNSSVEALSQLVEQDPSLSTRILAMVNSSWFGLRARVDSIAHALVVIGRQELAHLALMISSEKVFRGLSGDAAQALWRHSARVADIARVLGQRVNHAEPATLFTAALLHDVGKIVLLSFEGSRLTTLHNQARDLGLPLFELERETWEHDHASLGAALLAHWGLPAGLCASVAEHHGPRPGNGQISRDAALIALADDLAHRIDGSEPWSDSTRLRRAQIDALTPLLGQLTNDTLALLAEDLRDELRSPISA